MRQLILVRHGQYDLLTGRLTALGRRQAAATVRALREYEFDAIRCSTMVRAEETANILKSGLRSRLKLERSRLLCEALPTPVPGLTEPGQLPELRQNLLRMQRAHARLARPARKDRCELIVAHGNLIRSFVCLALEVKPVTWLKMRIHHCSISILIVKNDAEEILSSFNEVLHLPKALRTLA
ncbi:MAG TPA: histidine phosphatase family protein [Polyangiaceae bacterium]|nr:histidine phosphatase family protein [Polyangiaceae bacterium]